MDGDDRVGSIVFPAEHLLRLGCFDLAFIRREVAVQIVRDVLTSLGEFDEHAKIVAPASERFAQRLVVLESTTALHDFLRFSLVVPESRFLYPAVDLCELILQPGTLKDTSAV